jgi:hypothetical protein
MIMKKVENNFMLRRLTEKASEHGIRFAEFMVGTEYENERLVICKEYENYMSHSSPGHSKKKVDVMDNQMSIL